MTFDGWAAKLNGVVVIHGCSEAVSCYESDEILDGLDAPPEGLDVPGLRTEDITFAQRDGVKHFNDWYEPRIVTMRGTLGPTEDCVNCADVRQQRADLLNAWQRTCCDDIELVIFSPCSGNVYDDFPTPELVTERTNFVSYNSRGQDFTDACNVFGFTELRGFADGTGDYSLFSETTDLPANLPTPQNVVRKTWTGGMETQQVCYPDCYDTDNLGCYDQTVAGSNNGGGFLMGCLGQSAVRVNEGDTWTLSGYLRASADGWNMLARVTFYDEDGTAIVTEEGDVTVSIADTWHRLSVTATVPVGAMTMQYVLDLGDGGTLIQPGDTLDAAAGLAEISDELGTYFDGDFSDTNDPVLGGQKIEYDFAGADFASESIEQTYIYVPGPNRALNGPFGVVGRPRVAQAPWLNRTEGIAEFLLRFDGNNHLMYLLDECGTPGYSECEVIEPGSFITASCYGDTGVCYPECYDQPVAGSKSVAPTEVNVIGTQTIFPIITLNPSLTNPRIENITTGKSITFNGKINEGDQPVIIYTEDGTAFQGETSVSHLLGGTLDFSLEPGEHELRLISQSLTDTGTMQVCWRPAVLVA
jgi:hypothetical protein